VEHKREKIIAALDDHDYEQLKLLAAMKKIKLPELVRQIIKAHLDSLKVKPRHD
jgi:hypothetical protein